MSGSDRISHAISILRAIIFREIRSRYTGDALGYLWTYAAPLAWIAVLYAVFVFFGRRVPIDTDPVSFLLSGIIPYMAFRFGISSLIRARSSYRQVIEVMRVDRNLVYLGVAIVESYNILLLYVGLLALNAVVFDTVQMNDVLVWLAGVLLACLLGTSLGYFIVAFSQKTEVLIHAVPILLRPTVYISGVFYTANELPDAVSTALGWNPLFHTIEFLRSGLFLSYESRFAIVVYPLLLSMLLVSLGFARTRSAQ